MPFREAHHITGQIVALAEQKGMSLEGLTIEDFKFIDHRIDSRIHKVLSVEASAAARKSYGGTAPENVALQAARWRTALTGVAAEPREGEARRRAWRRRGDGVIMPWPGRCGLRSGTLRCCGGRLPIRGRNWSRGFGRRPTRTTRRSSPRCWRRGRRGRSGCSATAR